MNNNYSKFLNLGGVLLWLLLSTLGLIYYVGNSLTYILFSISFLILLLDGLNNKSTISYAFTIIFLALGFWVKLIVHLLFNYNYLEPIGYFNGTPESWDKVLWVSIVGIAAVMLAKYFFLLIIKVRNIKIAEPSQNTAPFWYPRLRKKICILMGLLILSLTTLNLQYSIFQIGLIPKTVLPWPLNGLMSWSLGFGLSIGITTLIFWDKCTKADWKTGFILVLVEGFFSTISMLSRATYIFHTIPYLTIFFSKFNLVSRKIKLGIFMVWLILLGLSLISVTVLRYSDISPIDASSNKSLIIKNHKYLLQNISQEIGKKLSTLIVDRWIGIEGVMAVVSYPKKSIKTFEYCLNEIRVKGKMDFYTTNIANLKLTNSELIKYQYATIPGAVAFFYYSNSLYFVFIGMGLLTLLMMTSELLVIYLTKNPYLTALWGMSVAQTVVSFGLGAKQTLSFYFVSLVAIIFIYFVQTVSYQKEKSIN